MTGQPTTAPGARGTRMELAIPDAIPDHQLMSLVVPTKAGKRAMLTVADAYGSKPIWLDAGACRALAERLTVLATELDTGLVVPTDQSPNGG